MGTEQGRQYIQQESPNHTGVDPLLFRRTMARFATGVTVITVVHSGGVHGMTANAFMSVSLEPPLVVVSVDRRARMHGFLEQVARYAVSILARDQEQIASHFAGKPQPGYTPDFLWIDGMPLIPGSVAHIICRLVDAHAAGDHTLFLGRVESMSYREREPLIFYSSQFCSLRC